MALLFVVILALYMAGIIAAMLLDIHLSNERIEKRIEELKKRYSDVRTRK